MTKGNVGIAVFNTHIEAENAVKELQKSGFDMKKSLTLRPLKPFPEK